MNVDTYFKMDVLSEEPNLHSSLEKIPYDPASDESPLSFQK